MAEWLRRLPAKQFPFGSVGSNPAVVVFVINNFIGYYRQQYYYIYIAIYKGLKFDDKRNKKFFHKMEVRGIDPRAPRMQSECSTI